MKADSTIPNSEVVSILTAEFLKPAEVAVLLKVSRKALAGWRVKGQGPAFLLKRGGVPVYPVENLRRYLRGLSEKDGRKRFARVPGAGSMGGRSKMDLSKMAEDKGKWAALVALTALALGIFIIAQLTRHKAWAAPAPSAKQGFIVGPTVDTPAVAIAGATVDSAASPSVGAREAQIQWVFGTVAGSYSACTAQAKTSYDGGATWLTLGSGVSLTVTTSTVNAWTVIEQTGTTSVTTSAVSSTVALGFGQLTKFTFACSGYGTSAPVTVSVIYR